MISLSAPGRPDEVDAPLTADQQIAVERIAEAIFIRLATARVKSPGDYPWLCDPGRMTSRSFEQAEEYVRALSEWRQHQ